MSNVSPITQGAQSPFHMGDRIRKVRELVGYTTRKADFADLVGIDRGSLSKYETTGQVKNVVLHSIARNTGARFEFLAYGTGPVFDDDPKESAQITERSLARVTVLRPKTIALTRDKVAPVTRLVASR